ncbi:hypothetical protein BAU15_11875 [Enterococcus sp. JM4C]|uniref:AAA family ATPase n=1 Tax=Candidatus Enterococcus huntleyi TaxID=1857217 RepID=UPI00137A34D3|nr:ATP-binding protein [Enterococcus sp. JM4C]KAF1298447.1 hypothetical protein BAU15_11875 [Enterococcus sp. JM4C]
MFTELVLENFKSFNRIFFDMTESLNSPKKLIAIYGENGSGKSSLIEAFGILRLSMDTVERSNTVNKFNALAEKKELSLIDEQGGLSDFIQATQFSNIKKIIDKTKTIGIKSNMQLEYSFLLQGNRKGKYIVTFDQDNTLVKEQLDYTINERIGNVYTIEKNKANEVASYLNKSIFLTVDVRRELDNRLQKLWGKHSFMSIFKAMEEEFNESYIDKNIKDRLKEVITFFSSISVSTESYTTISQEASILSESSKGSVKSSDEEKIDKTEKILYNYFSSLYVDIKDVFYKKNTTNNEIDYQLYLKKSIYGKLVDIPVNLESRGTKKLLEILPFFLNVVDGGVCFIDEIDNGIHDILMNHLLDSLSDDINGQLVFTTHDTLLLKELPKQSVYFITIDYEGNKKIKSLRDYDNRTVAQNNNFQNQYLKGVFEGIPLPRDIDFEEINQIIQWRVHE